MHQEGLAAIREDVRRNAGRHLDLLKEGLKVSFTNLSVFQSWVAERMRDCGLRVEEFTVDRNELDRQPACRRTLREEPTALQQGPNMVRQVAWRGAVRRASRLRPCGQDSGDLPLGAGESGDRREKRTLAWPGNRRRRLGGHGHVERR